MAVSGALSVTLEVPDIAPGVGFYTDAGLEASTNGETARLRCHGREQDSIILLGGVPQKRLHHVTLRATDLEGIRARVEPMGGQVVATPEGFEDSGLWVRDPNGMLVRLVDCPDDR